MNSLRKFQNGEFKIERSEDIFYQRFEDLFGRLHNGKNIVNFTCRREDTKAELQNLLLRMGEVEGVKTILSVNGDTDIPCIKREYLLQDDIPYTEDKQSQLEILPLSYFVEEGLFDVAPSDLRMYCHSVIKKNPNLYMIPLGRDPKGKFISSTREFDIRAKETLCYYNCSVPPLSIHWYGRIRSYIHEGIKNKDFVKIEHVGLNQNRDLGANTFINYYESISSSKFMICPRGCALDTYRLWDCLYLGCIPIVVKYEGYQDFEDLPILFLEKWEDYLSLTEDYLNEKYSEMLDRAYNYEKLKFSWWENEISSSLSRNIA
jgi:hypothetical protein